MKRLAYYGGSFSPCHVGHQATVLYAIEVADVERVVVAPVYQHPDGKILAPYNDRLTMCCKMAQVFAQELVLVSRTEEEAWGRYGTGTTADAVKTFRDTMRLYPDDVVVLVIGEDLKQDIQSWTGYDYLHAEAEAKRLEFFFVPRTYDTSSTQVRSRLADGRSYRHLVPARVYEYLERYKDLYPRH